MEKDIKRRRPNWSEGELVALAEAVVPRASYLKGKLSPSLTAERKQELWEEVADEVNSVAMVKRTVDEMKKKWADMQSLTKKKEGERRRSIKMTGGGPGPNLIFKCWENLDPNSDIDPRLFLSTSDIKVLKSLSDIAIEGISGGVDTAECVQEASSISITAVVPSTTDSAKPRLPIQDNTMPQSLSGTSSRNGVKDTSTLSHGAVIPLTEADKPGTSKEGDNANASRPVSKHLQSMGGEKAVKKKTLNSEAQQKTHRRDDENCANERYFKFEEEKLQKLENYRKRKLELLEEVKVFQQRSCLALERIAETLIEQPKEFSLSPVIKF